MVCGWFRPDSGTPRDRRPLKHRAEDETPKVPSPPELTALLHRHMKRFGTSVDGKLFRGVRSKKALDSSTYERIWTKARAKALPPQQLASQAPHRSRSPNGPGTASTSSYASTQTVPRSSVPGGAYRAEGWRHHVPGCSLGREE